MTVTFRGATTVAKKAADGDAKSKDEARGKPPKAVRAEVGDPAVENGKRAERNGDKSVEKLAEKIAKKRAKLAETQAELAALEADLAGAAAAAPGKKAHAVSPFAPARFPNVGLVEGVTLAAVGAGVRYAGRLDVGLLQVAGPRLAVAGVFTRSRTRSAPVLWCQDQLVRLAEATAAPRRLAILVNSGNANAFTGEAGARSVEALARATAQAIGAPDAPVLIASTGVIGEPLPADRIGAKLVALVDYLSPGAWEDFARAIMTTDTYPKAASAEIEIDGKRVRVVGVAKGSGMIAPDMATMLSFVATDAVVEPKLLRKLVSEIADETFNAVTVDGDTSTSDSLIVAASGASGHAPIAGARSEGYGAFRDALHAVLKDLALQVVKDGEGLSKFVEVRVEGARTARAARRIGLAIANSPLVKTAWAGADPNWGRIVMAVGKSGEDADRDRLTIRYGPHPVAERGGRAADYDEPTLAAYMRNRELVLSVDVGVGQAAGVVWTCDLTHAYVSINADYRS